MILEALRHLKKIDFPIWNRPGIAVDGHSFVLFCAIRGNYLLDFMPHKKSHKFYVHHQFASRGFTVCTLYGTLCAASHKPSCGLVEKLAQRHSCPFWAFLPPMSQIASRMPKPVHAIAELGAEPSSALGGRALLQQRTGIYKRMKILCSCPVLSFSFHSVKASVLIKNTVCVFAMRMRLDLRCFANLHPSQNIHFTQQSVRSADHIITSVRTANCKIITHLMHSLRISSNILELKQFVN